MSLEDRRTDRLPGSRTVAQRDSGTSGPPGRVCQATVPFQRLRPAGFSDPWCGLERFAGIPGKSLREVLSQTL
jgi:hypothetical protein